MRPVTFQIVETYDIKEDVIRCAEIIATGSRRYPDLAAWISVGGWPVFTRNALAGVDPAKTKVISFTHLTSTVGAGQLQASRHRQFTRTLPARAEGTGAQMSGHEAANAAYPARLLRERADN